MKRVIIFLLVGVSSLFSSEAYPWRHEPFALLLIQKAHETKRASEKKIYLQRVISRLKLPLQVDSLTPAEIDHWTQSFYTLFTDQESSKAMQEALKDLQPLIPVTAIQTSNEEINVVQALEKLDGDLFKAEPSSWKWVSLELSVMYRDLLPLMSSLTLLEDKLEAINWYLFFLKEIRYPPLSDAFARADYYSSLREVLSSRQGICLGTTILYTALCQRFAIPISIFTPPGHIFPAVPTQNGYLVIETTARGSHVPLDKYETIEEPTLLAEPLSAILAAYVQNKAATLLIEKQYQKSLELYRYAGDLEKSFKQNRLIASLSLLLGRIADAKDAAKLGLKNEDHADLLLLDIVDDNLPPKSAEVIFDLIAKEMKNCTPEVVQKMLIESQNHPKSLSLRYYGACLLLSSHRALEAKALLESSPVSPDSLSWNLLKLSIASKLNDHLNECALTVQILKQAKKEKKLPQDLLESCFSALQENPDCQELAILLKDTKR